MNANDNDRTAKPLDDSPSSRYILKPLADWWAREEVTVIERDNQ
jgi:hypothetical protein